VRTPQGQFEAGRLLLSAGAYNQTLLGEAGPPLAPKRVPVHWITPPQNRAYQLGTFPVVFWQIPVFESADGAGYREFYALPVTRADGRVKVAFHNGLADCNPTTMDRQVTAAEVAEIRLFLGKYLPALAGCDITSNVCLYTQTPDGDFYLGPVPGQAHVLVVALAGHGFKFAPVLGEILADLLTGRPPTFEIDLFSPGRFF
jgi:sarcosine oxidase